MKITRLMATAAATVFMATVGTAGAPIANSAPTGPPYPVVGKLGDELTMTDTVGQVQLSWRVSSLKPGSDVMPGYRVDGNLWEATATVKAIRGSVTPAVSQFNAVAPHGLRRNERIERDMPHLQRSADAQNLAADVAQTDQPQRSSRHADAHVMELVVPAALARQAVFRQQLV